MRTHTPGPWRTAREDGHIVVRSCEGAPRLISGAEPEANATLISAAPEMLDALNTALDWLREAVANEPEDYAPTALYKAVEAVESAIAKATSPNPQ